MATLIMIKTFSLISGTSRATSMLNADVWNVYCAGKAVPAGCHGIASVLKSESLAVEG